MTKAWPRIDNVFKATISKIWPNWENMAYSDFFNSEKHQKLTISINVTYIEKNKKNLPILFYLSLKIFILAPL